MATIRIDYQVLAPRNVQMEIADEAAIETGYACINEWNKNATILKFSGNQNPSSSLETAFFRFMDLPLLLIKTPKKTYTTMEKIIARFLSTFGTLFLISCVGGTILWLVYEHIHVLFPTAAKSGIIARHLDWWDSVCVSWIFNILVRPSSISSSSGKKD